LDGFYNILLRGGGIRDIVWNFTALMAFFAVNLGAAVWIGNRTVGR